MGKFRSGFHQSRIRPVNYRSRPLGRAAARIDIFFRSAWLRSRRASLPFLWRWNRALSPLRA